MAGEDSQQRRGVKHALFRLENGVPTPQLAVPTPVFQGFSRFWQSFLRSSMTKTSPESCTGSQGSSHFNVAGVCRNTVDLPFDGSACLFRHGDERFAGPNDNRRLQVHPTSVAHGGRRQQVQPLACAGVDPEDLHRPPGLNALQVEPGMIRSSAKRKVNQRPWCSGSIFSREYRQASGSRRHGAVQVRIQDRHRPRTRAATL